ncbi:NADH dehydrogenase FAD-containing subunit [Salinadaptatus halalkaliphilus]|uniref:NADH dehydrogenase FAD-containing subunit n=1 Tax=Salinadaptatus halalkaliphilus TaxID=2419781 RepID=A0A4S3TSD1_9EURY|nr:FAD-dependent oxidoreductase [Salinadaptatus halalkaliphilus]THE66295.1 NADH dehydrogenase FAD-containing subunit [Salinadaptatus halalkaliphilus]
MHVVVLGGGYAGLTLTRLLEETLPSAADITLVNDSPDHLVQHELHRIIRRPEFASAITVSLPAVLERATVRVARVESIDRDERVVELSDGTLSYDIAAICLGARTAYYGLEGVREHALPLKRLSHATRIRSRARELFAVGDPRIVVGGAGLSGVQVAGELAALAREYNSDATVTIVEQFDAVAPQFSESFQRAVATTLESQGVEIRTDATVSDADDDRIVLESGAELPADLFVWTGGIRGAGAVDGERVTVPADLRLDDRTFVVGDAARVVDADDEPVPASAQAAVREARTAAENVAAVVEADSDDTAEPALESVSFESPGWVVSVGDDAVAQVGSSVVTGKPAKLLKRTVGVGYRSSIGSVDGPRELARVLSSRWR